MSRESRVYCGWPNSRLSAPAPVKSRREQIATSTLQGAVNKGLKFNSCVERSGLLDRASSWTPAPIRDGMLRPPLDRAVENQSLEESFRVFVPVASSFEVFSLSERSVHNLRWRDGSNQPSSSTIRLSEQFGWAYSYSTLI